MRLRWLMLCLICFINVARATDFLDPDHAFVYSAQRVDAHHIVVTWNIADGCYLYRDKLHFQLTGATLGTPQLPVGLPRHDPVMGDEVIYRHQIQIVLPFGQASAPTLQLDSSAQGCADGGICYAPVHHHSQFVLADATSAPDGDAITRALAGGQFASIVAVFFVAGLLLALTPCVFPMIPVLSGIIVGQNHPTRLGSLLLSLAYVLGMAITYAAAGVAAALSGTLISNTLQNPWALSAAATLFVVLALSMFGLYELQLPSGLQSRFSDLSNRFRGGHMLGTFMMGALSALIIGPCVAPPLAAALAWIARTGDVVLGGVALFFLALGMGVPLLLIGLTSGSLLPRAGAWMNSIKQFFGILMLGVSIWLIAPLLNQQVLMLLWSALLIIPAVVWHALDSLPAQAPISRRVGKGLAVMLLTAGIALLLSALAGGQDVLHPLSVFHDESKHESQNNASPLAYTTVHSLNELDAQLAQAKGHPVMLDFYADWCVSCKEMDTGAFQDPILRKQLSQVILLRADITNNSADDDALRNRYGVFGPPVMVFFNSAGQPLAEHLVGIQTPSEVSRLLAKIGVVNG